MARTALTTIWWPVNVASYAGCEAVVAAVSSPFTARRSLLDVGVGSRRQGEIWEEGALAPDWRVYLLSTGCDFGHSQ